MNVVILGCGRTGATLALQLSARGHKATVIEKNPESLRRLGKQYPCRIVLGNGLDEDVIAKSGLDGADAFFAVTRGDNTNLMAAHIVRSKYPDVRVCVKGRRPPEGRGVPEDGALLHQREQPARWDVPRLDDGRDL
jgi:trk system potassium uptake protein TrkA